MDMNTSLQLIAELLASESPDDADAEIEACADATGHNAACIRQWAIKRGGKVFCDTPIREAA